ncbi:MAG: hypothetical protein INR64_14035, partial [Caulobacteraceae bacterium]|nr:hypothetical protein [Caulobacter sp.]
MERLRPQASHRFDTGMLPPDLRGGDTLMPTFRRPAVLAFDVNETVLDIMALEPLFLALFGRREAMREWYAQLILHSQAMTLAGAYAPLPALAAGVLRMMGTIYSIDIGDAAVADLAAAIKTLPAHADVRPALERLRAEGFRTVTLTNSAPDPEMSTLARAGIDDLFERQFS